jgi:hypothetical protein
MDEPRRRRLNTHVELGGDSPPTQTAKNKKKKRRRYDSPEIPFWRLFLQVAASLLLILIICFGTYRLLHPYKAPVESNYGDDDTIGQEEEEEELELVIEPTRAPSPRTARPLPVWELSEQTKKFDAYGLVQQYTPSSEPFWSLAETLRTAFSETYGGENAARAMLERGMSTFGSHENGEIPSDLQATSCRLLNSQGDFKIVFGGYSVTVGRGNYFHQSFPFVMQTKLEALFDAVKIELEVRNAAIGGVPSLPYGWCLENFWGLDPDVVSWDYSMNEAGGIAQGLEAYLRQTQTLLHKKPKLIVKDTHMATERRKMLQKYVELGSSLVDPVVVHGDPAIEPFMAIEEKFRPIGFRDWRKFGAPPGAPGQAAHHPAKREHELYGWMLTMHFLAALELMVLHQEDQVKLECVPSDGSKTLPPKPISTNDTNSLLFGADHKVHCRTSLEPILSGELKEVITSGLANTDNDLLMPKGAMYYNKGWVLDLSEAERLAKRKLDRHGGLGFVDSKKAYYGIYMSGSLSFHLPMPSAADGSKVSEAIRTITLCQVNERQRDPDACKPESQVHFWIGGQNVTDAAMMDAPGTLYLGHKLCINLPIPEDAIHSAYEDEVGINVTVRVSDKHIMKKELACSVSHILWEEK